MTAVTYFVYDRDNIHKKKLASAEKALDWNGTPYVRPPGNKHHKQVRKAP